MIKIAIYEDNAKLREVMCQLLETQEDFQVVGHYENCAHIIENCHQNMPHVILMDIDMPVVNGIEGLKLLRPVFPEINVLMLTVFEDNAKIFQAIKSGAAGYLLKNTGLEEIIKSIYIVQQGGAPLSPYVAKQILSYHTQSSENERYYLTEKLSERENDVVQLLAEGFSVKMIADKLNLSQNTILTHLKRIYQKLEVHSAIEAINKLKK